MCVFFGCTFLSFLYKVGILKLSVGCLPDRAETHLLVERFWKRPFHLLSLSQSRPLQEGARNCRDGRKHQSRGGMCCCRVAMRNPAAGCPLGPLLSLPKPPLVSNAQLSLPLPSQTPTNRSSSLLATDSFSFRIAVAQCLTRAAQGRKGSILTHSLQPSWLRRNTDEVGSSCGRYSRRLVTVPQFRHRGDEGPALLVSSFLPLYYGATHNQGTSSLLIKTSLERPSQTHPEVCLPGDFKSSHGDSGNYSHLGDSLC